MKDATQTLTNFSDQPPELTAICPRCDNPQADNFYSPEQEISFIYCSKCGYDAPRDDIYLAPQQEPAVQVPAAAPAAGHLSTQLPDSIPQTTVQMLDCFRFIFGIDTANGHYQDILFDVMKSHLFSNSINFNDLTVYEIRALMMTADSIFDHLMSSDLSTKSVNN